MTQHEMRKIALQALYLANQNTDLDYDEACNKAKHALNLKKIPDFSQSILKGVLENKADLDQKIGKHLKQGWTFKRLNQIDQAILELGLYEMQNSDAIDEVAALDEALNLSEEFSSPKSKAFINGVLANFLDEK